VADPGSGRTASRLGYHKATAMTQGIPGPGPSSYFSRPDAAIGADVLMDANHARVRINLGEEGPDLFDISLVDLVHLAAALGHEGEWLRFILVAPAPELLDDYIDAEEDSIDDLDPEDPETVFPVRRVYRLRVEYLGEFSL
jgi:hypothetical protein